GDLELGRMIETHARHAIHEAAARTDPRLLAQETRRVRVRLESEKSKRKAGGLDIKHGTGGMLDVYFAARYLQLRDDVRDEGDDRSTASTLDRLAAAGALSAEDHEALGEGYVLLRSVDHQARLILGRSSRLPSPDHVAVRDIARQLGYASGVTVIRALAD